MNSNLLMNFTTDRESKKISIKRAFAAPLPNVWAAWTESEILDKWWAPKPWKAKTKTMDFREGGYWLYAMLGPEGEEHWSRADYITITPLTVYTSKDAFCDAEGTINETMPRADWTTGFSETGNNTIVSIDIQFAALEDLEFLVKMGFKEGITACMENLDAIFAQ